jgi:hypothetical protein
LASLDGADVKALRETMDKLKDKLKSAASCWPAWPMAKSR